LDGVVVVEASGQFVDSESWNRKLYQPARATVPGIPHPTRLVAIPYYAWGNRKIGAMRIWIPYKSI
jgi:DUF1680 family protein